MFINFYKTLKINGKIVTNILKNTISNQMTLRNK